MALITKHCLIIDVVAVFVGDLVAGGTTPQFFFRKLPFISNRPSATRSESKANVKWKTNAKIEPSISNISRLIPLHFLWTGKTGWKMCTILYKCSQCGIRIACRKMRETMIHSSKRIEYLTNAMELELVWIAYPNQHRPAWKMFLNYSCKFIYWFDACLNGKYNVRASFFLWLSSSLVRFVTDSLGKIISCECDGKYRARERNKTRTLINEKCLYSKIINNLGWRERERKKVLYLYISHARENFFSIINEQIIARGTNRRWWKLITMAQTNIIGGSSSDDFERVKYSRWK